MCGAILNITQGGVSQIVRKIIDPLIHGFVSQKLGKYAFTPQSIRNGIPNFIRLMFL